MRHFALLVLGLAIVCGCRKADPPATPAKPTVMVPAAQPPAEPAGKPKEEPAPAAKAKDEPAPAAKPKAEPTSDGDVTLDLSRYRVRGEMRVPAGTTFRREKGTLHITAGPDFHLELQAAEEPLGRTKAEWKDTVVKWLKDEANLLVAERKSGGVSVEARVKLGDTEVQVGSPAKGKFTPAQAERLVRAIQSLKQTDAIRAAIARETEVRAALTERGCRFEEDSTILELKVLGPRVTDDDLARVTDVPGVTAVEVWNAPRLTGKGTAHLARLTEVRKLQLIGDLITDELLAPFRALTLVEEFSVMADHQVSDTGLAALAGWRGLTRLFLSAERRPAGAPRLTGAGLVHISRLPGLKHVHLTGAGFGDAAIEHLGTPPGLEFLSLEETSVTDAGLGPLARLTNLEMLDLSGTQVRGPGLANLPRTGLESLNLNESLVTDAGLAALRGSEIKFLYLNATNVTDGGLGALAGLPKLYSVELNATAVTDAGLEHLAAAKSLSTIDLAGTAVAGPGLAHLARLPGLTNLNLSDTAIGDAALAGLATYPKLTVLDVERTAITDAGLDGLRGSPTLAYLRARGTDLTAAGVARFKAARPKVDLSWREPDPGPDPKPVPPPVAFDKLKPADPKALVAKYDRALKTEDDDPAKPVVGVDLSYTAVTDEELAHLRGLKGLRSLNLSGCEKVTDAGLPYLAGLTDLRELRLDGTGVRGDGLTHLGGLKALTLLFLPNERMTLKQLAALRGLSELRQFGFAESDGRTGYRQGFWRVVSWFPKLQHLAEYVENDREMAVAGRLTGLTRLSVPKSSKVTDRGLAPLAGLTNLTELDLTAPLITDAGLQHLAGLSRLENLELDGRRLTEDGFQVLKGLTALQRLSLENARLSDAGLNHLRPLKKLTELALWDLTAVTDAGLAPLADLKGLQVLRMRGSAATDAGMTHLAGLKDLQRLELQRTAVPGDGFKALAAVPALISIDLSGSLVTKDGARGIAAIKSLTSLDLARARLTDEAVAELKALPNLEVLVLDGNPALTDKVVETLTAFPMLRQVSLKGTRLSPAAIERLKKKPDLRVEDGMDR
jgi:internalin A